MADKKPTGLFLVLEGGEGAGKTSQAYLLVDKLREHGAEVLHTQEPGATRMGAELRRLIFHGPERPAFRAEALMFAADRAQHVEKIIMPALLDGKVVVCDRYVGSTMAYQGVAGMRQDDLRWLCQFATQGLQPHLTIYLDVDPVIAQERLRKRAAGNRNDTETMEFHHAIRASFRQQATNPRWIMIDASYSPSHVHNEVAKLALYEAGWFGHVPQPE